MSHVLGVDPEIQTLAIVPNNWTYAQMLERRALCTTEGEGWPVPLSQGEDSEEEDEHL